MTSKFAQTCGRSLMQRWNNNRLNLEPCTQRIKLNQLDKTLFAITICRLSRFDLNHWLHLYLFNSVLRRTSCHTNFSWTVRTCISSNNCFSAINTWTNSSTLQSCPFVFIPSLTKATPLKSLYFFGLRGCWKSLFLFSGSLTEVKLLKNFGFFRLWWCLKCLFFQSLS